jgi:hypothetical protein
MVDFIRFLVIQYYADKYLTPRKSRTSTQTPHKLKARNVKFSCGLANVDAGV